MQALHQLLEERRNSSHDSETQKLSGQDRCPPAAVTQACPLAGVASAPFCDLTNTLMAMPGCSKPEKIKIHNDVKELVEMV